MRRLSLWGALALALLPPALLRAQIAPGSRPQAIGAYTALANDIYGVYYNPAAPATFSGFQWSVGGLQTQLTGPYSVFDLLSHLPTDTQSDIDFARRFSGAASRLDVAADVGVGYKNFAISVLPFGTGIVTPYRTATRQQIGFDFITVDGQQVPAPGSNAVLTGQYGYQLIGTVAHSVGKQLKIGINLKLIDYVPTTVTVAFNGTTSGATTTTSTFNHTTTFGADVGALYTVLPGLTVGATLRNMIQPVGGYPTVLSTGAAYRFPHTKALVAADLADIGHSATLNLGGEFSLSKLLALRAGINQGRPTIGIGIGFLNLSYGLNQSYFGVSLGY
jgi:hypothetical protein